MHCDLSIISTYFLDILDYSPLLFITLVYILCVLLYRFKAWVPLTNV